MCIQLCLFKRKNRTYACVCVYIIHIIYIYICIYVFMYWYLFVYVESEEGVIWFQDGFEFLSPSSVAKCTDRTPTSLVSEQSLTSVFSRTSPRLSCSLWVRLETVYESQTVWNFRLSPKHPDAQWSFTTISCTGKRLLDSNLRQRDDVREHSIRKF